MAAVNRRRQRHLTYNPNDVTPLVRLERLNIKTDQLQYSGDDAERPGVFVAVQPLSPDHNYFEVEILHGGIGSLCIGLVPKHYQLDDLPGYKPDSIGYNAEDGRLYKGRPLGTSFGPKCDVGDWLGCGVRFIDSTQTQVPVFFSRNGKEIGSALIQWPSGGLYPSVGLSSSGEAVRLNLTATWLHDEDMLMAIDSHEDDWLRLHDIKLNGQVLEYTGRGRSIVDVGLAQARRPLNTTFHYFEIEIVDPGENCYIAIGLARRDYPKHRHPGWNKGSIAYHADDGKIFNGTGVGDAFGPRCHKGDIMGCGIIFPRDYECDYDSDGMNDGSPGSNEDDDPFECNGSQSESEDEEWWNNRNGVESGIKVQVREVFFTRNGKTIGRKEIRIPKGGFYPTVGMLSNYEKVKFDLQPLSG